MAPKSDPENEEVVVIEGNLLLKDKTLEIGPEELKEVVVEELGLYMTFG